MNDTIYRRDAIQALIDTEEIKGFAYRMLEDRLMEIPSADQQQIDGAALISAMSLGYSYGIKANRPQGEWIFKTVFPNDKSEFPMGYLVCSVCGSHHSNSTPCNYCDNCGAQMFAKDINTLNKKGADNDI